MEVTLELVFSRGWENFEKHDRKFLHWLGQNVNRKKDVKYFAREGSRGNQEHGKV